MLLNTHTSQLVLVDYQARLMPAIAHGARVLDNAVRLAKIARIMDVPICGTAQNPDKLGANDERIQALCQTSMSKMHFSAVADGLLNVLQPAPRAQIVIAGCEAHVCLLQTALDLIEYGHSVWVVTDACGSRTTLNRDLAFQRLVTAGAHLVSIEMVAFEWLRSASDAHFKEVLALVR